MKYTEENFIKLCNTLNFKYIKYKVKCYKTKNKMQSRWFIYYICPLHQYKGIQSVYIEALQRWVKTGKCKCVSNYRHTTDDLKRDNGVQDSINILSDYVKSNQKILCECKICGYQWEVTPNHLQGGRGCPNCNNIDKRKRFMKSQDDFIKEISQINPTIEIISQYKGSSHKIKYKCKICGKISESTPSRLLRKESGCHRCNSSTGENIVAKILDQYNIKYIRQYRFKDCKYKAELRFDFYIKSINMCIEYQGEQHYFPVNFKPKKYDNSKHDFELNQIRDNIKRNYCKNNNILLLEIPYWEKDNIDRYLINKFKEYNIKLN